MKTLQHDPTGMSISYVTMHECKDTNQFKISTICIYKKKWTRQTRVFLLCSLVICYENTGPRQRHCPNSLCVPKPTWFFPDFRCVFISRETLWNKIKFKTNIKHEQSERIRTANVEQKPQTQQYSKFCIAHWPFLAYNVLWPCDM